MGLWRVCFVSMSGVPGQCLLKKNNKHASLLYICIFENVFEKARETSEAGLFCEGCGIVDGCGIIDHGLRKVKIKTQTLSWKSPEGVDYIIAR